MTSTRELTTAGQVNRVLSGGIRLSLQYPLGPLLTLPESFAPRSWAIPLAVRYAINGTARCDLFIESLSHVDGRRQVHTYMHTVEVGKGKKECA